MRRLTEHDIADWVNGTLLSPGRTKPIVAVTTLQGSEATWLDPAELERQFGNTAEVVVIPTGDPTWALAEALPPRLEAYGGAIRVWWPGLTREANPLDHRLWFVRDAADVERVQRGIVESIAGGREPRPVPRPAVAAPALAPEPVRVTAMTTDEIVVSSGARRGPLLDADLAIPTLIRLLNVGCRLQARPWREIDIGRWSFSITGLLPDPWPRFASLAKVGHVYACRVQNIATEKKLVFVDVMPGVVGVCSVRELDHTFVERIEDFVQPGELLPFAILDVDSANRRLQLSRKRAFTAEPMPLPPLFEGGNAFEWQEGMPWFRQAHAGQPVRVTGGAQPTRTRDDAASADHGEKLAALSEELQGAREERMALIAQIRQLREQLQESRRDQRAAEQRLEAESRRGLGEDPLASERAFLQAVRVTYSRMLDEHDRFVHPLARMRVGREFLATVHATPGIETDKLLEVCVQVACDMAHTVPGRDVHPLRAGSRGADARFRKRDGAKAWRCALKQAPSAPRLHWWNVPSDAGAVIEFACVGLHDHVDIPE